MNRDGRRTNYQSNRQQPPNNQREACAPTAAPLAPVSMRYNEFFPPLTPVSLNNTASNDLSSSIPVKERLR